MNMKQKKTNKKPVQAEHHFGVILENIDSKLDLLVEGHQGLDKRIEKLDEKVDGIDEKLEDFRKEVSKRFNEVDYKFEIVFDELHFIRNDLKEKVSRDEFVLLEKRVAVLERTKK